jgi:hypothetical protein
MFVSSFFKTSFLLVELQEIIPEYMKLKGYDMFYCIQNKFVVQQFEKKKRKGNFSG